MGRRNNSMVNQGSGLRNTDKRYSNYSRDVGNERRSMSKIEKSNVKIKKRSYITDKWGSDEAYNKVDYDMTVKDTEDIGIKQDTDIIVSKETPHEIEAHNIFVKSNKNQANIMKKSNFMAQEESSNIKFIGEKEEKNVGNN